MMHRVTRAASCLAVVLALTAITRRESLALVSRPALERGQDKSVPEVDRLDASFREFHLRPNDSRIRIMGCSTGVRGMECDREYSVIELRPGDNVAMQVERNSRGISYADLVRVHESPRDRDLDRGKGSITRPGLGIRTVDGKVKQVDRRRNSFEIRSQSGERIFISLPNDTRRSEIDRFRTLRAGDYVRVEGRFLDRERFELENFI